MSKRKSLSIRGKNLILREVDTGVRKMDIALKFGIPPNSLSTIIKNRDKIQNYDSPNSCSKRLKACVYENVDEAVLKWALKNKNNTAMNYDEDEDNEDGNDHDAEIKIPSHDEMLRFINFNIKLFFKIENRVHSRTMIYSFFPCRFLSDE
ncbi:hypothetical protein AVEN_39929-1 [Araneus ventricosus]|uniref:HTH psq-type domain-containing protein n=1 Tax=Araneus ventricosus TaxID=182803 RepID=A0A4Y2G463_ARAVE|nr:hypothetical protein AVEN_39929-1 [Araneus ventricosus]